jgi:hypothetical protein
MLLGAGLGSIVSGRLSVPALRVWAIALPLVLAGGILIAGVVSAGTIGAAWPTRAAIAFAVAGSMGLFMGLGFPVGLMRFGDPAKAWYWAINGACGVVASVCSLGLAMTFGFDRVMWLAVALYALAVIPLALRPAGFAESARS